MNYSLRDILQNAPNYAIPLAVNTVIPSTIIGPSKTAISWAREPGHVRSSLWRTDRDELLSQLVCHLIWIYLETTPVHHHTHHKLQNPLPTYHQPIKLSEGASNFVL